MTSLPKQTSPLLSVLQHQVVPWVRQYGITNVMLALPTLKEMQRCKVELPPNAYLTPKPLKSAKVVVKNNSKNSSIITARWPDDGLHTCTATVLGFVVEGNVAIPLGDYVLHCKPSQAFLIPPGTPYPDGSHLCIEERQERNASCSMFSLRVWQGGVVCWLNHTRKAQYSTHKVIGEVCHVLSPKARSYMEELTEEMQQRTPYFQEVAESLFKALILLVLRDMQQMKAFYPQQVRHSFGEANHEVLGNNNRSITQALEFVRNHLDQSLNIDKVAAHVYMSRAHFTRQFQKSTGVTFNQYLKQCRIDAAKALLADTEWPVQLVSKYVGVSVNHLTLLFKQNLNMTPTEYRKKERYQTSAR